MHIEQGTKWAQDLSHWLSLPHAFTISLSDLNDTHMQAAGVTSARKRNAEPQSPVILKKLFFFFFLANQSTQKHCLLAWCSSQEDAEEVGDMWSVPKELIIREMCACSVNQSCLTLSYPADCSPPGSFVHGILQARILEWVAIPSSRVSSLLRDWIHVPCFTGGFFTAEPPGKPIREMKLAYFKLLVLDNVKET